MKDLPTFLHDAASGQIPIWLKAVFSIFLLIVIPVYWKKWGPANFLWLSDVTFILTAVALWTESEDLTGAIAVTALLPEIFWNIVFFVRLLAGRRIGGLTDYMFDNSKPLWLRALSLFHVVLPPLWLFMLYKLGYSSSSLPLAIALTSVVFALTYFLTNPEENINSVFGFGKARQKKIHPLLYLLLYTAATILLVEVPAHFILRYFFS